MRIITPLQQRVYAAAMEIPRGEVTTYKLLADYIRCGSPRAVRQALRNNPFAPDVPCHRIVRSDLNIGGFAAQTHGPKIKKKTRMLREERVRIEGDRVVGGGQVFSF
jgi:methylated-DNA-[protein]-cysteine S-methyltransferase